VNHAPAGAVFTMWPVTLLLHAGHLTPIHSQPSEIKPNPTKDKLKVSSSGMIERAALGLFTRHTNRANRQRTSTVDRKNSTTFHICFVLWSHDEFKRFYRAFPVVFDLISSRTTDFERIVNADLKPGRAGGSLVRREKTRVKLLP